VLIKTDCDVVVYTGFTPNGDGINDFFIIDNIDKYPNNNIYVYNRWGNKVFFTSRYDNRTNNWDGKVNGKPVTSGTYFYLIVNDNDKLLKKGWIEITN
jgi:gliding motility-associated-like protein